MAEAMTVETILEADLQQQGYWTRVRFPLRTARGGWSDIDVLGYHPERRQLIFAESKVRGPKKDVYAFTPYTKKTYGNILEYDGENYFGFLKHVSRACADGVIFDDFQKMVRSLTIVLVSNYYVAPECMKDACRTVMRQARRGVPRSVKFAVRLETTLDVIARIIASENVHLQGRRYGNPALDIARELNRYMHPNVKFAGRGRAATEPIKRSLSRTFEQAFRVKSD